MGIKLGWVVERLGIAITLRRGWGGDVGFAGRVVGEGGGGDIDFGWGGGERESIFSMEEGSVVMMAVYLHACFKPPSGAER